MRPFAARACRLAVRFALLAATFTVVVMPARAQVDEATAELLMRASGLWEQLGVTAAGARAGIEAASRNGLTPLSTEEVQRLLRATDAAFEAGTLRAAVRRSLAAQLPPADVAALEAWLAGEPGRRITALEVAAARPERDSERAIRSGIEHLATAPPERKRLLESLVEASHAAESITNMTINIAVAVQRGMAGVRPDLPAPPVTELRQAFAAQRAQMLGAYRGMSQALFAEMYSALPDADLAHYLAFLRGGPGARFVFATMAATEQALVEAAERLGTRLPAARPAANT
ncbi:MAG: hypothetical protein JNL85_11185 [Rubrivivax sp.]|nr:hypothetical protein [Rubrivivax sp.]